MSLTTLTPDELYAEIADLARDQGATSKDVWAELVEEVVESHLSLGEIDLDDDVEGMKEILRTKWRVYKTESVAEEDEEALIDADEDDEDDGKKEKDDVGLDEEETV